MWYGCFQWFKDTNLKANHNALQGNSSPLSVVSNGSKILIWKQITTEILTGKLFKSCFQWFKDTNLKANHNDHHPIHLYPYVVSNGSKILIWKQITTLRSHSRALTSCFQWFKDTNLKANHNRYSATVGQLPVVSNGSKILIWKQITTENRVLHRLFSCFQWFKDTNLKANHN